MNSKSNFIKFNILNSLKGPSFYVLSIIFSVFAAGNFYIRQGFFTGSGQTDLTLFFSVLPYICIIVIPALCYRHSFSIYDDFIPLSRQKKILINFLTCSALFLLMLIFLLPAVLLVNLYGSTDFGQIFTSFLCLFFYGSCIISLSILIQVFIENKILAFVTQTLILALFNACHLFAIYVKLPAFLVSFFKQISFAWHFDAASKGILDTRDIFWFTGLTIIFLIFSVFVVEKKAGKKYTKNQTIPFLCKILLGLLIILNGGRWYKRIDFSQNKTYTVSSYTKKLLQNLNEPLKITFYQSSKLSHLYPQVRDVRDFLNLYTDQSPKISLLVKDPDKDEKTRLMLENYGIQTQQMRTVTSTSTEYINVYSAIILEYQGFFETIPFTMSANTLEYDLDIRVRHLLSGISRNVNIIIGNGLSLENDYSYLSPWLTSQGFYCNEISIQSNDFSEKLSQSQGPLVIIGDGNISIDQAIAIEDYILNKNHKAFIDINPYSVNIEDNWYITENKRTNVVEMVENWGVKFTQKIAADISCSRIKMFSEDQSQTRVINYPLWLNILQQENTNKGLTLFWATPLELSDSAIPYLYTSPMSYSYEIDKNSPEKLVETNPFLLEKQETSSLKKGNQIVAARIQGPLKGLYNLSACTESDIIVIPDQYFVNTLMTGYIGGEYGDYRNFEFLTSSLLKLNGEEELSILYSKSSRDNSLYKISDVLQFSKYQLITYLIIFILLPLVIIISGVIINVKKIK